MRADRIGRILLFLALVAAIAVAVSYRDQFDAAALEAWLADRGAWAPLIFIGLYAAGAVLFLPGSVMTLAGGALFGPVWGTLFNLVGATLGAMLAFLAARYLASDWVARRTGGRLKQLITGVEKEGWRFVAFVRLVPLFPFNLLNYALGLTRIGWLPYALATFICMAPGALAYTYLGYAGREAIAGGEGLIQKGLLALALLALVAFLPRLIRRVRSVGEVIEVPELHRRLGGEAPPLVLDVRGDDEFAAGHIDGARHIPLDQLDDRLAELDDWRERPVAVICRTDRRSAAAVQKLLAAGFVNPVLVRGGMEQWQRNALPTTVPV